MTITIIYASTGGNTAWVCERVADILRQKGAKVRLVRIEEAKADDFKTKNLILASPTYGHGLLEVRAERFYAKNKNISLKGTRIGIIGLGNPKYDDDYTVESAKILKKWAEDAEGTIVGAPLALVGMPYGHLEAKIAPWAEEVWREFKK